MIISGEFRASVALGNLRGGSSSRNSSALSPRGSDPSSAITLGRPGSQFAACNSKFERRLRFGERSRASRWLSLVKLLSSSIWKSLETRSVSDVQGLMENRD